MSSGFPANPAQFLVTDVGSTTTKAILFRKEADRWRFLRQEAPTTVEKPHEDVTVGVDRAVRALEAQSGATLLRGDALTIPYLSTSSAGGGLAMVVSGLMRQVTSHSAERVALGAGAILLDVIAMDDGRTPYEKIQALKTLRPDMVLLAGGFDGDAISGPVFLAELAREAGLRPKLSPTAALPIVFAGNVNASDFVRDTLGEGFVFHPVPNIRPTSDQENLEPAREAIHDLFMSHVMSQAPGYEKLISRVSAPIVPTPSAFGKILALASRQSNLRTLAIDIGGATTDVFTAEGGHVFRTVSANLGMSYSILNVVHTAGIAAVAEVLDVDLCEEELWDRIGGKYVRPTGLPRSALDVKVEWAAAAIAIREAVKDHLRVMAGVSLNRGKQELAIRREFGSGPKRKRAAKGPLRLQGYDLVIGSGGILSHSPRAAAAMMLVNALRPKDQLDLAVDSAFMFPHLGVLSDHCPDLALDLFHELGLVRLGPAQAARVPDAPGRGRGGRDTRGPDTRGRDDRSVAALLPEDLAPSAREAEVVERESIYAGAIRMRRELAIAGQVFVKAGDLVESDAVIARSSRQFLRPFLLDLAQPLKVNPREVSEYLLKKVGEDISTGELLARRKVNVLSSKEYVSPVTGRVERILPSGTVVVRENPEDATQLSAVNVAKDLRIRPDQIRGYLRVDVGQPVEAGQWVAGSMRPGAMSISRAPVRGRVKEINCEYGIVTIEPLLEQLEILAWMPGRVEAVTERGCIVASRGIRIEGIWGRGGEVSGALTCDSYGPGLILVKEAATREDLSRLDSERATGLVTGSLHLKDVLDLDPAFTIVVTAGFGQEPMRPQIYSVLEAHAGRLALLDGKTELRVGVRRPRIILPEGVPAAHSAH